MDPYRVLGVDRSADVDHIRRAYLERARRFHPDRLGSASDADRRRAATRMAEVNEAWSVLRDPARRAELEARDGGADSSSSGATIHSPGDTFRPLSGDDLADVDIDDTPSGTPTLARGVLLVPAALAGLGVVSLLLGATLSLVALLVVGLGLLVAAMLAFILLPVVAMVRSSRAELAAEERRRRRP